MIVLWFTGLGTLQRRPVFIRSVNCDGGKRLLVKARHFDLKQRAAFGANEFPQLQFKMQGEMRSAGLRRHHAPISMGLPIFGRRTEIGSTDAAEVHNQRQGRDVRSGSNRYRCVRPKCRIRSQIV